MSEISGPGWYYAEGDPPGTQRYWDGELWIGEPVPPPPTQQFRQHHYREQSQATTALVMSILGFVCCGVLFPIGWKMGHDEVAAIDAGRRDPTNRGTANAAKIVGMIGTVLLVAAVIFYVVVLTFARSSTPGF